jgi:hypothetical protein
MSASSLTPAEDSLRDQTGLTAAERTMRAAIASNTSWANTENRNARTEPGRQAMWEKFENQVDPDRKLTAAERHKRAANAYQAHFQRMALKSAKARPLRKEARQGGAV